jgi:hypothetical protein
LFASLKTILTAHGVRAIMDPLHTAFRTGDVRHSQADVSKAMRELGYAPAYRIDAGLEAAVPWYRKHLGNPALGAGAVDSRLSGAVDNEVVSAVAGELVSTAVDEVAGAVGCDVTSTVASTGTSANVMTSAGVNHAHVR